MWILPNASGARLACLFAALSLGCAVGRNEPDDGSALPDSSVTDGADETDDATRPDVTADANVDVVTADMVTADMVTADVVTVDMLTVDVVSADASPSDRPDAALMDVVTPLDAPDVVVRPDVQMPDVQMPDVQMPDVVVPTDTGACAAGTTRPCYSGPAATRGVGACRDGTQTCISGAWNACSAQVLPTSAELCGNGADDDCNGMIDDGCMATTTTPQVSALSVGNVHACLTDESHQTSCWGGNPYGQIASIAATGVTRPTRLATLDAVQIASNENFLCLRRTDGTVACTGINTYGQLGDGTLTNRMSPVTVTAARDATWIAAGYYHVCVVAAGGVRCWGRNDNLQLGAMTSMYCSATLCSNVPVAVPGISTAVQVVGGLGYSCALLRDGTVRCWGDNTFGQLGIGTTGGGNRGVTNVPGLTGVVQLAGGHQHVCALLRDGTVRCWGSNSFGQLLDTSGTRPSPTTVPGLGGVVQLVSGVQHLCARLTAGALRCWGYNFYGQTGDGTMATPRITLSTPVGLPPIADVAAGYWNTCARTASGDVWCWGWNLSGEVGDGTTTTRYAPVRVVP